MSPRIAPSVENAVASTEGDRSEDTLNRSLIDLSPGESYCARSRFPQWHSSLLSRSSQYDGGGSPFSSSYSGVPVLFLVAHFPHPLTARRPIPPPVLCTYTARAPISVCAGNYWGGRACGGMYSARGEAAAAAAAVTAAATSGQSLVSRPSEQQAPREARRASERSPLCGRGQWARVGARCTTECE